MSKEVIPQKLAIEQLRSGGYKDTAHALAELIDNSIQAGAKNVEVLCAEMRKGSGMRVSEIGVLDDGAGMNAEVMQIALQFGNGTRKAAREGMGKFGMGLPMASISQVKQVEVYSWQGGGTPLFSYIDVDEIASGEMAEIPVPIKKKIPDVWRKVASSIGKSGTLIVWKNPDRLKWVRGSTITRHSEFIVGRMYRHMLLPDKGEPVGISIKVYNIQDPSDVQEHPVLPNDPLMLHSYSHLPDRWATEPICEVHGELVERQFRLPDGTTSSVKISYSIAKEAARHNPEDSAKQGTRPHGKHAQKHMGVSVVRAGRELEMLSDFVTDSYLDRWWGVEISFEPDLDELFGVTNNKQSATGLAEVARAVLKASSAEVAELKEIAREDGDTEREFLIDLVQTVATTTSAMNRHIRDQGRSEKGGGGDKRYKEAQRKASAVNAIRDRKGAETFSSGTGEGKSEEEKTVELHKALLDGGHTEGTASRILDSYFKEGLTVEFVQERLDSPVLFSPVPKAGKLLVKVNSAHPGYQNLVEVLDLGTENVPEAELRDRLSTAAVGMRLLFASWARMEDEMLDEDERNQIAQIRQNWGIYAREYLR